MYASDQKPKKAHNRLIHEKSPYLLQHAENPVDWYAWGEEAFQKAKKEDKPIFLSIGYATCHWCHVMAHESFEDEEVAQALNTYFIAIKVDREERPDIDKIYMSVCQAMTGRGGWPLSIFMTHEGKPFFAGTYFPKLSRMGMPGFMDIIKKIAFLWKGDRSQLLEASEKITKHLSSISDSGVSAVALDLETLKKGYKQLEMTFDQIWGGFGTAPKFPTPHHLTFLLRWYKRSGDSKALNMVEKTLDAMRRGGIFDQMGFGFHRYSVDERWLVPHFEKMLYDQALLAMAYIEAYQVTGNVKYAQGAHEIFTYVTRDMTSPHGGFYSAEDADSEGIEGLFYLFTPHEIRKHLGAEQGNLFCRFYNITEKGNFEEGRSILHMPMALQVFAEKEGMDVQKLEKALEDARKKLFAIRKRRIHPQKDDKILTAWNGLMIADAARMAADFILKNLKTPNGRLLRRYRQGDAAYPGYLDDYAFLIAGLLDLYEATFEVSYLKEAIELNESMVDIFWDKKDGGLYFTGQGNESLITRSKEVYDGALPSGNSVAALNFLRLSRMTGNIQLEQKADQLIRAFSEQAADQPMAFTQLLIALDFMIGPSQEIVVVGDPSLTNTQAMIHAVQRRFLPNKV
ncbi:MAG: thioredoxin domain-containing protein, partial [Deltaproteobacteria bacterium]|nr:thioredoxin domain-containing protein [Deltaproteobacteria bacterium]